MTLPNFLIIGAAKAGTTSLYDHLRAHPAVFMPTVKEPRFFGYDGRDDRQKFPVHTLAEYEALFAPATTETAIGEATPHYLSYPQAAGRIHALIPGVRLIASLRNPVDRAYSTYLHNLRNRNAHADTPFARVMETDHRLHETYAEKLERYFALFPRERIRILLLEDLEGDPRGTVRGLYGFLGVDPGFEPEIAAPSNPGGTPRIRLLHALLAHPRARAVARAAFPPALNDRLRRLRSRNLQKPGLAAEDRRRVIGIFRDDIRRTQDLIDRDLSHWLAV